MAPALSLQLQYWPQISYSNGYDFVVARDHASNCIYARAMPVGRISTCEQISVILSVLTLNLHWHTKRQCSDSNTTPRWLVREPLCVLSVHLSKVGHICNENLWAHSRSATSFFRLQSHRRSRAPSQSVLIARVGHTRSCTKFNLSCCCRGT